nr:BsuBI/PstI family type II restriction endonuclease [uncultured Rhodopila sp.]
MPTGSDALVGHAQMVKSAIERRRPSVVRLAVPERSPSDPFDHDPTDLQRALVTSFLPRFCPAATLLYPASVAAEPEHEAEQTLMILGLPGGYDLSKAADVVAYDQTRNWLFLITAEHPSANLTLSGHQHLREELKKCRAARVYVAAFATRREFRRRAADIVWNTRVWIAEEPEHLIHFDGGCLVGPYESDLPTTKD